jgi:hypothetical protein
MRQDPATIRDSAGLATDESSRVEVSARSAVAFSHSSDVERALANAVAAAAVEQRWDVVAQLARELEARRLAREGVLDLEGERRAKRRSV